MGGVRAGLLNGDAREARVGCLNPVLPITGLGMFRRVLPTTMDMPRRGPMKAGHSGVSVEGQPGCSQSSFTVVPFARCFAAGCDASDCVASGWDVYRFVGFT